MVFYNGNCFTRYTSQSHAPLCSQCLPLREETRLPPAVKRHALGESSVAMGAVEYR